MDSGQNEKYKLVFQGPIDDAPETMRKLKAALIVDLNLSIEQAQAILQGATTEIITADSEMELKEGFDALRRAGGRVLIVHEELPELEESIDSDIKFDDDQEEITFIKVKKEPPLSKTTEDIEIDFSFEDEDDDKEEEKVEDPPPSAKKEVEILIPDTEKPLFDLRPSESEDSDSILDEDEAPIIPKALRDRAPKNDSTLGDLSLSFDDAAEETHIPSSPLTRSEPVVEEAIAISFEPEDMKSSKNSKPREKISIPLDALAVLDGSAPLIEELTPDADKEASISQEEPAPISADIPLANLNKKAKKAPGSDDGLKSGEATETLPEERNESSKSKPTSKVKFKKQTALMDYVLPVALGTIVLLVGNLLLNSSSETKSINFSEITQSLAGIATQSKPPVENVKPKDGIKFIGRQQYDNRTLDGDFTLSNGAKSITAIFKFESPKPEELSKEQLGRKERQIPWVRKVEVDKTSFELSITGAFEGQAPARIYLEDDGETQRFVGTAKISGAVTEDKRSATAEVKINYQSETESGPFVIKRKKEGDYSLHIAGEVTARSVE